MRIKMKVSKMIHKNWLQIQTINKIPLNLLNKYCDHQVVKSHVHKVINHEIGI